mmetsp:Transcript_2061/g.2385  ORF Transcript_2061/g.2385 Transcript_2061/m.2385 type:complete len:464 (+) Transcript_2061:179-1570(+)
MAGPPPPIENEQNILPLRNRQSCRRGSLFLVSSFASLSLMIQYMVIGKYDIISLNTMVGTQLSQKQEPKQKKDGYYLNISTKYSVSNKQHNETFSISSSSAPPDLQDYLGKCQTSTNEIKIECWMGRSGNQMHQLVLAFSLALASGRPYVTTLEQYNDIKKGNMTKSVWNIPSRMHVKPAPPLSSFQGTGSCPGFRAPHLNCDCVFHQRCPTTVTDRRDIYMRQIRPLLRPEVLSACKVPRNDTLVIHVRDGDVAMATTKYHAQPPCHYFHHVIETGNRGLPFEKIMLVHSNQKEKVNWCVKDIQTRHAHKMVEAPKPTSVAHDTCVVLQAKNLALTTSSFGITLAMMNTQIDQLFVVDSVTAIVIIENAHTKQPKEVSDTEEFKVLRMIEDFELDPAELCAVFPRAMHYRVPVNGTIRAMAKVGQEKGKIKNKRERSEETKRRYFLHFDKYAALIETNCSAW